MANKYLLTKTTAVSIELVLLLLIRNMPLLGGKNRVKVIKEWRE